MTSVIPQKVFLKHGAEVLKYGLPFSPSNPALPKREVKSILVQNIHSKHPIGASVRGMVDDLFHDPTAPLMKRLGNGFRVSRLAPSQGTRPVAHSSPSSTYPLPVVTPYPPPTCFTLNHSLVVVGCWRSN